jgi:NADH-quinone oxidoreductase subunit C/D
LTTIASELATRFEAIPEETKDGIPTFWCTPGITPEVLRYLKASYPMLYDLTAIDEREHKNRSQYAKGDFTMVYQLLSLDRNEDIRIKVSLSGEKPSIQSITGLWPAANWYEREVFDMFGITFADHPHLRRLLMPPWWEGHPLRKDHHARATEKDPFHMGPSEHVALENSMVFRPEEWGMKTSSEPFDYMFLNVGPQHLGTHGLLRIILQMLGMNIVDAVCDIGFHHRGAEKMGERQSWHTYIPYTDRVDYLAGCMNNFPYLLAVEKLAGIEVPPRAMVIRIMMAELFRIISHLVYLGTYCQDLGAMSAIFYIFSDRERALDIVEAISGGRMHPSWFRIGGVAQDLPKGWDRLVADFLAYLPKRLHDVERMMLQNRLVKMRTKGIGSITTAEAIEWGATGPMLRSTGIAWDLRKVRPYGGYDQFEFDIPVGEHGDCYDRMAVHVAEMHQSLRIIEQCLKNMPSGPYKAVHSLAVPPLKDHTLQDIETLITHFLGVSWGPVLPPGEVMARIEGTKGLYSYYLTSDGSNCSYRTRIRTASFPHIQMVPMMTKGWTISDLIAILGSIDFVLADVDR